MNRRLAPVSPGDLLSEEFMTPLGMSPSELAGCICVPAADVAALVAGSHAIDATVDHRLSGFFGLSNGYWLRVQSEYDAEVAARVTR